MRGPGVFRDRSAFALFKRDGDRLSAVGALTPICCALLDRRNKDADGIEFKIADAVNARPVLRSDACRHLAVPRSKVKSPQSEGFHFYYHFQEGGATSATAAALRHALLIAGRPILFATLINASGFLALALSNLPPMRQFGIVASSAFALALLADFTALPGALWILSRAEKQSAL